MSEQFPKPTFIEKILSEEIFYYDFGIPNQKDKTIYFQSQLHGNETFGTLVLYELIRKLKTLPSHAFTGFIRIAPSVNPFSWNDYLYTGEGTYFLHTGINWNKLFDDSTISGCLGAEDPERYLSSFSKHAVNGREKLSLLLMAHSVGHRYIIDVHTPERGQPHLYCSAFDFEIPTFGIGNIVEYGEPCGDSFDELHIRYAKARSLETTSVTLELPNTFHPTEEDVSFWVKRFLEQLSELGIIDRKFEEAEHERHRSVIVGEIENYTATESGIILYHFQPGQVVKKGEALVTICPRNCSDMHVEVLLAREDCLPVSYRSRTEVKSGEWAVRAIENFRLIKEEN